MHGQLLLHTNRNYHWDCSGHLFCGDTKVRGTRGNKAKAGLICGIIGIIGSVILITVFVVNILLSSDFQNEMKEFNTHYDTYIDENDDSI